MDNNVIICDGMDKMDFDRVTEMLSVADWSLGIKKAEVVQGAANSSLVTGAFIGERQIGYARVVSDRTRYGYICDVYVDEAFRGHGAAKLMLEYILAHASLKDVYRWLLKSSADELYIKAGFEPVSEPHRWMEIRRPGPERARDEYAVEQNREEEH